MRATLLLVLLLQCLSTKAQLMDWGAPQKVNGHAIFCRFLGFNEGGYYYLRSRKSDFSGDVSVEKYSRSLELEWTRPIPTADAGNELEQVLLMKHRLLVIRSGENYANGFTEVKFLPLSFDGEFNTRYETLFQIKSASFYDTDGNDVFNFAVNEDKTAFFALYIVQAERKRATVCYNAFGEDGLSTGSSAYNYAGLSDHFFINSMLFQGTKVYTLVSYHDEQKRKSDDVYEHDVLVANLTTRSMDRIAIELEGKIQSDLGMHLDTITNTLKLCGFYSEKNSTSAAGIAMYSLPVDSPHSYTTSATVFPKELLAKIMGEKASDREKELPDFVINNIIPRNDGGLVLVTECFYVEKQPYSTFSTGTPGGGAQQSLIRTIYNYDEVLLFSIEPDGSIDWWQAIVKNQSTVNDGGYNSSIATLVKKEAVYVFFNLSYKNSNEIMEYSIANNGTVNDKILLKSGSYFVDFAPRQSRQIASGSILMPVMRDRKFNLLKITY